MPLLEINETIREFLAKIFQDFGIQAIESTYEREHITISFGRSQAEKFETVKEQLPTFCRFGVKHIPVIYL